MKNIVIFWMIAIVCCFGCSKENTSPDAVEMVVDFSWKTGNIKTSPELIVSNVPMNTKQFKVRMFDLTNKWEHSAYMFAIDDINIRKSEKFTHSMIIPAGKVKGYSGPGGSYGSPRYEFTVKAIDDNGTIIGIGKKMRRYPEDE